ncbi:complex subunit [Seminavis robusta]|uniref:Complex subunit n=1 Tax=Seminavis robusta TaxID=568900 RepID=A0A9N8DYP8_9STRA|nr:complex subunit [Seminavis robusta]|eukprot:Sro395_g133970.1 complex subunit (1425) ;mRNA; r:6382-10806
MATLCATATTTTTTMTTVTPDRPTICLANLVKAPLQQRMMLIRLDAPPDAEHWTGPPVLWPCIYFRNYSAMMEELAAMHKSMMESNKDVDKDVADFIFYGESELNILATNFIDAIKKEEETAKAEGRAVDKDRCNTVSPMLLLETNELMLNPDETTLHKMDPELLGEMANGSPDLIPAVRWVLDYAKGLQKPRHAAVKRKMKWISANFSKRPRVTKALQYTESARKPAPIATAETPASVSESEGSRKPAAVSTAKKPATIVDPPVQAEKPAASVGLTAKKPTSTAQLAAVDVTDTRAKKPAATEEDQPDAKKRAAVPETAAKTPASTDDQSKKKPRQSEASAKPVEVDAVMEPLTDVNKIHEEAQKAYPVVYKKILPLTDVNKIQEEAQKAYPVAHKNILDTSTQSNHGNASANNNSMFDMDEVRRYQGGVRIQDVPRFVQEQEEASAAQEVPEEATQQKAATKQRESRTETATWVPYAEISPSAKKQAVAGKNAASKPAAKTRGKAGKKPHNTTAATVEMEDDQAKKAAEVDASACSELPAPDSPEMDKPLTEVEEQPDVVIESTPTVAAKKGAKRKKGTRGKPPRPQGNTKKRGQSANTPLETPAKGTAGNKKVNSTSRGRNTGSSIKKSKTQHGHERIHSHTFTTTFIGPRPEAQRKIPTFGQVKSVLEELGYSWVKAKGKIARYCCPSYGSDDASSKENGKDYAETEEEFRTLLCAKGVARPKQFVKADKFKKLERWVRSAVVTLLKPGATMPQVTVPETVPKTLYDIGYSHSTNQLKKGPYDARVLVQKDLINILTYEGLSSDWCDFDKASHDNLLLLQMFLAFYERDMFEPPPKQLEKRRGRSRSQSPSIRVTPNSRKAPTKTSKARKAQVANTSAAVETPTTTQVATKAPPAEVVPPVQAPMVATKPAAASSEPPPTEVGETQVNEEAAPVATLPPTKTPVVVHEATAPTVPLSPSVDKTALANCNGRADGGRASVAARGKDSSAVNNLERTFQSVASVNATDGKAVVLAPGSHFQQSTFSVLRLLRGFVQSRLKETGKQPATMFICGSPGIGKTTAVDYCCEQVKNDFSSQDGSCRHSGVTPVVVSINCSKFGTGAEVLDSVKDKIWAECKGTGSARNDNVLKKQLTSTNKNDPSRRFLILVLDEIDQLVHQDSVSENPRDNKEKLIDFFSAWASDSSYRVALIGIGNTMAGPKFRRLKGLMSVPDDQTITFGAFSSKDLEAIMAGRLGDKSIVDPKALSYIAKKFANLKGDARPAMELLTKVLKNARERSQKQAGKAADGFMVKIRDVVKAATKESQLPNLIEQLPLHGKMMVYVAVGLAQKNRASEENVKLTRGELFRAGSAFFAEKFGEHSEFSPSDWNAHIDAMDDMGLAIIERQAYFALPDDTIVFEHFPDELETALQDSLTGDDRTFFGY